MEADGDGHAPGSGVVKCAAWIRRPDKAHLVVIGNSGPSSLQIHSFDAKTTSLSVSPKAKYEFEGGVEPVRIAVHPSGDQLVCFVSNGDCKLFELSEWEHEMKLTSTEQLLLQGLGQQKCLAFSYDGTKFATGGLDGHLRIYEWPSMRIILDEPNAHKSFRDMDFSLDSEYLASTSTDGSARIWNTHDGALITTLTRNQDEKIELCRFSKDGTKPFLFTSVQRGSKALTVVWDISTWKKVGNKRLLGKPASMMTVSLDGKYLAQGSKDGDICVVEVKKMMIHHWSKRLHLGNHVESLDFCPSERVILTTSREWGSMVTKLNVPADWKEWQIYLLLFGLILASVVAFYIFFEVSDSFWNFPPPRDHQSTRIDAENTYDQSPWEPLDL